MKETQLASVCGFKRPNSASADASLHQQVTVVTVSLSRARRVLQRPLLVGSGYCEDDKKQNRSTTGRASTSIINKDGSFCSQRFSVLNVAVLERMTFDLEVQGTADSGPC